MIIKTAPPVEDHRKQYWRDGSRPAYFTVWMGDSLEHRKFNNMDEATDAFRQFLMNEFGDDLGDLATMFLVDSQEDQVVVRFEFDTRDPEHLDALLNDDGARTRMRITTDKTTEVSA